MSTGNQTVESKLESLPFENRFIRLGEDYYQAKDPVPVTAPYLVCFNPFVARVMGLDEEEAQRPEFVEYFSGNRRLPGAEPLAMAYSGHQFGAYNPQLGDGRGVLLGELATPTGSRLDLYLKGCGQTRFCRGFDGRATLKSSIREHLAGEALAGLGVPTTRSLAVVGIGELIYREHPEPAAVLVRVAETHVRFGNFEIFHYTNRPELVTHLTENVLQWYFPDIAGETDRYRLLFRKIVERTAELVAHWQAVGFTHGVMNTDNMSILGQTFDFGPYGFMDRFSPGFVPNHSDTHGRYAYGRQPEIAYWNLGKLGETLSHLIPVADLEAELQSFKIHFNARHMALMARKLGLSVLDPELEQLIDGLYKLLYAHQPDYTNFFRRLANHRTGSLEELRSCFHRDPETLDAWLIQYNRLLEREDISPEEQQARMNQVNPKFILRNYLAQQAIDLALKEADFSEIQRLQILLQDPYRDRPEEFAKWGIDPERYAADTPDPYLGMQVSCSA